LLSSGGFHGIVPFRVHLLRRLVRLSHALGENRAGELPIPTVSVAVANRYKLNDIRVLQLWKLSHAVRQCFIRVQSERMKQFVSAYERQKGAHRLRRAPSGPAKRWFFLTIRLLAALRSGRGNG
jgi:hypothetical protein